MYKTVYGSQVEDNTWSLGGTVLRGLVIFCGYRSREKGYIDTQEAKVDRKRDMIYIKLYCIAGPASGVANATVTVPPPLHIILRGTIGRTTIGLSPADTVAPSSSCLTKYQDAS